MTADLNEEHSTATLAAERLEAEQADRLKLERENAELTQRNRHLASASEKMEMELLYSRALDLNGAGADGDSDEDGAQGGAAGGVLRQKYERTARELELTKKRLATQHEDDMEQLMAIKKQLEKKVSTRDFFSVIFNTRYCETVLNSFSKIRYIQDM